MALDDREQSFEKALARELRADALNGLHCPDAETLSAYHERMLSPEQMIAQKSHIAGCERCQEVLATLEMTEAIPISERDSEEVVEAVSERMRPEETAAPITVRAAEAASAKQSSVREMPKRMSYLRWAVPAGAIAAGLLAWIAVHPNRAPMTESKSKSVEVAENREPGKEDLGSPKPAEREALPRSAVADKAAAKPPDQEKQELDALAAGAQSKIATRGRAGAAASYTHGPRLAQNQMQNQIQNNEQIAAQNQPSGTFDNKMNGLPSAGGNAAGGATADDAPRRSESTMKAVPATPTAVPAPVPTQGYGAGSGTGAANPAKPAAADAQKDEMVRATTQTVEVTSAAPEPEAETKEGVKGKAALKKMNAADALGMVVAGNLRDSGAGGLSVISTPDPKVLWIISVNGAVLKTEDGEKSFRQQKIGQGINVLAGSAVNKKICWLIAERGIVLRTTDGGKHWETMTAPAVAKFTGIKAVSAMEATITDASGSASYSTADGGVTWSVVARR